MELVELMEKLSGEVVEMHKDELTDGVTDTYRELVSDIMEVIEKSKIFYDEPCVLWSEEEYILSF